MINRIESELIARERRNKAQQQGTSVPRQIPDKKPLPPIRSERRTAQK